MDGIQWALIYTVVGFFALLICIMIINIIRLIRQSKKFKKKLATLNLNSIEEFLQLSLSTKEWEYIGREMKAYPISNDTEIMFVFREERLRHYTLSIEQKGVALLELVYDRFYGEYADVDVINDFDKSSNKHAFQKRYLDIMNTTLEVFSDFRNKKRNEEQKEEELQIKKQKENMETKRKDFVHALKSDMLWTQRKYNDFEIQIFQSENYHFVSLFFEKTPIFNATYETSGFSYQFLNQNTHHFSILEGIEGTIISYFCEKMEVEREQKDSNDSIEQMKKEIEDDIKELQTSSQWLTEENKHVLSHTYPHDIEQLFKTYVEMKQPKEVEEDVIESLIMIQKSLQYIGIEVEKRKQKDIIKRKRIIETRV